MKRGIEDDPLARGLAALPEVPMDAAAAEAVRRRAVIELVDAGASPRLGARLSLAWTTFVLPGILLSTGGAYTWGAVQTIGRIFVG